MRAPFLLGLVVLSLSTRAFAQFQLPAPPPPPMPPGVMAGMPPPRDTSNKSGTAVIRGRVLAADTGQPLRKVFIRASSPDLREGRVTSTDVDGRYELKELPAGRYTLNASKGSFVSLAFGQLRPFEQGKPLEIADGQTIEKVDFALPRGAIITGRIVDEFGEPVADAQVAPMRYVNQGGRRRMQPSGRSSTTNDIGEYRIFGLPPGTYYISATLRGGLTMAMNAQSDDRSGYAPTYYPGTTNTAEAQKITLALAQVLNDVNVTLIPTRVASVSGTVSDVQGRPLAGGMVMVVQRQGGGFSMNTGGMIRPDGSFTVNSLAPGDYTLQVNGMAGPGGFDNAEFATADITVAGEDITGVRLASLRPSLLTGRIVFTDAKAASSVRPAMFRLSGSPRNPEEFSPFAVGQGRISDDFTFEIKARPARVVIRVNLMSGGGWMMKAVRLNGVDVTDIGIDVKANEDLTGLEIELTNRMTEVSGAVTNSRGEAVKEYSLVVFSRDRELWGPGSRFMRTSRPDQDGRYKISGLPVGSYYAIALDYIDPADNASDPEFLDRIRDKAATFALTDGETKTLDLKLTTAS